MILDVRALVVDTLPTMLLMAAAKSRRYICIFSGSGRSSKLTMVKSDIAAENSLLLAVFQIAPSGVLNGRQTGASGLTRTLSRSTPILFLCESAPNLPRISL